MAAIAPTSSSSSSSSMVFRLRLCLRLHPLTQPLLIVALLLLAAARIWTASGLLLPKAQHGTVRDYRRLDDCSIVGLLRPCPSSYQIYPAHDSPIFRTHAVFSASESFDNDDDSGDLSRRTHPTPRMIVFDKDGTLGDCSASLIEWMDGMTYRLVSELRNIDPASSLEVENVSAFHEAMGYDSISRSFVPSAPLAAGTWAEQFDTCTALFGSMGIEDSYVKVRDWHKGMGSSVHGGDPPVEGVDLRGMMEECKNGKGRWGDLKVAVCTSDDRGGTDEALERWGLTDVVDVSCFSSGIARGINLYRSPRFLSLFDIRFLKPLLPFHPPSPLLPPSIRYAATRY